MTYSATYAVPGSIWRSSVFRKPPIPHLTMFCDDLKRGNWIGREAGEDRIGFYAEPPALEFGQIDRVTDRLRLTTRDGKVYSKLCRLRDALAGK